MRRAPGLVPRSKRPHHRESRILRACPHPALCTAPTPGPSVPEDCRPGALHPHRPWVPVPASPAPSADPPPHPLGCRDALPRRKPVPNAGPLSEWDCPDPGQPGRQRCKHLTSDREEEGQSGTSCQAPAPVAQDTRRVLRFMKSMRMNWPSVIVLVKYAFPLQIDATCLTNSTRLRSRASMNVLIMIPLRRQLETSR